MTGLLRSVIIAVFIAAIILSMYVYIMRIHSCIPGPGHVITVRGSTAFAPLVQDMKQEYQCPLTKITVNAGSLPTGSFNGLNQVEKGTVDIGMSDVFADPSQNLEDHQVAVVPFGLVINGDVSITGLTTNQVRGIYSGRFNDWHDVGSSIHLDIVRVSRPATSGTRATFERYVLGGVETISGPSSLTEDISDTVAHDVQKQPGAIGYVSLYFAKKYGLRVLSIDGQLPTSTSIASDTYKFWSIEHMYTRKDAPGWVEAFINYIQNTTTHFIHDDRYLYITEIGQDILMKHEQE